MTEPAAPESPPWRSSTRIVGAIVLLLLIAGLLYAVRRLLLPVLLGLLLAYMLAPILDWVRRRTRMPRLAAAVVIFFILLLVLGGAATGIGLAATQQLGGLIEDLILLSDQLPDQINQIAQAEVVLGPWTFDLSRINAEPLVSALASILQPLLSQTGTLLASLASATASAVGAVAMVAILAFYMLVDMEGAEERLAAWAPPDLRHDSLRLFQATTQVWRAFVRGQLVLSLVLGLVVAAVLSLLGVRFSLVLGLLAGVLDIVPFFGPFIAGVISVIVALFQGSNWWGLHPVAFAAVVLGVFLVIQQVENNILVPGILGRSLEMSPLTVLLAAMVGGSLAGIAGVLLAQPVTAMLRVWFTYFYRKTAGLDPWPPAPPEAPPKRPVWPWSRKPKSLVRPAGQESEGKEQSGDGS
jgi:predicted PurR-regulated permease PerM